MAQTFSPEVRDGQSLTHLSSSLAELALVDSRPGSPHFHIVKGGVKNRLLTVNGSRLHYVTEAEELLLRSLEENADDILLKRKLCELGLDVEREYVVDSPLESPPLRALSLAIAQKCNMACTYCYAEQGDFGGPVKNMPLETAFKSIDFLVSDCKPGERAQLTFLGGEPLINREAVYAAVEYAAAKAEEAGVNMSFSMTTNGTLLTEEDAHFFEKYGFSITVSLDGVGESHNVLRSMKNGAASYDKIIERVKKLLKVQHKMQVSARVTVTPLNMNLAETLDEFINMGFHSVGFSPLLRSSNGQHEMSESDLKVMLQAMIECGLQFEKNVMQGKRYPFLNMLNALKELSKGTHRPYPCGAGAGYMGVSADGELSACHRFVNEEVGFMGNISDGISTEKQNTWLADRHVHKQSPCNKCWARYLCGGGCHHELVERGRHACDYIRGWLYYTIQAQERLLRFAPDWYKK